MAAKIFHPLLALSALATNSTHVVSMMVTRHTDAAGPCRGDVWVYVVPDTAASEDTSMIDGVRRV